MKKILITAGNTQTPIDKVRAITNIFKGKTGTDIAKYFAEKDCAVTLITSNPDLVAEIPENLRLVPYRTFDELETAMRVELGQPDHGYDVVIHSAAVSDYETAGIYFMEEESELVEIGPNLFTKIPREKLVEVDKGGKVSSGHRCLYLKLTQTKKLVDLIRKDWGFKGVLIKFKLEVGKNMGELLAIAEKSLHTSGADYIVANCLEWAKSDAYIMNREGKGDFCKRAELAAKLYERIPWKYSWGLPAVLPQN
jgi:phosphopantothenate-cysteine ligase/phosphopantothenoylcysteine decarboxylase/phosphopantothenate--cysteine ligase